MHTPDTISSIYWDVAKNQINRHIPLNSRSHCNALVTMDAIEKFIHIKAPMVAGITSIQQSLKDIGIKLPDQITDIIIYGKTPHKDCEKFRNQIQRKGLTNEEKGEIVLKAIAAVHKQRVKDNSIGKKFADTDASSCYIYMPIELIGFNNAREDFVFIREFTEVLSLRPSDFYIEQAYRLAKSEFYEKYAIYQPLAKTMERAILCLPPVNPAILRTLQQNSELRLIIVKHILQNH